MAWLSEALDPSSSWEAFDEIVREGPLNYSIEVTTFVVAEGPSTVTDHVWFGGDWVDVRSAV